MARPLGFHTITLGCKLNQFDGAAIEGELARRGFVPEPDRSRAAVVVINTCTVTHRADSEARRLVRAVRRSNPGCRLLVTGCYAERDAAAVASLDGVDHVFGNRDKPRLGPILDALGLGERSTPAPTDDVGPATTVDGDRGCDATIASPAALHFGDRTRAFLKIQQGCRLGCSYCIIPQVRGPSRSVPPERIEAALLRLTRAGFREIVLTGVNTGDWGRDLRPRRDLAMLLRGLLRVCGPNRIRLNSLEPRTVSAEIVALMVREPRLAPHLQIPLQSGSDAVLRAMRRNYRAEGYLERVRGVRRALPHAALGADVIVGFPGESDAMFEETLALVRRSPLNYLHVFPWSPRPGTPATELPDRVPAPTVRERSRRLRELASERGLRFRRSFVGKRLDAVVLGSSRPGQPPRALTGNFIEVRLETDGARRGEPIEVEIDRVGPEATYARRLGRPAWAGARTSVS